MEVRDRGNIESRGGVWAADGMGSSSTSRFKLSGVARTRSSKRLIFDRRYGWVYDEWKDPSEAALAGGRGMFCIVPLAKAVFDIASQSVSHASTSLIKVLERPDLLSPQLVLAGLNGQLCKCMSSIKKSEANLLKVNLQLLPDCGFSDSQTQNKQ